MAASVSFLPKIFRWAFTVFAVLSGIGALAICVVLLVNPHLPPGAHFGPITTNMLGQPGTLALRPAGADSNLMITALRGNLTFAINQAGGMIEVLKHYGLPVVLLDMLFLVALFELLRRLFRNVGRGESFTPETIRLVQYVGGLLIVFSFVVAIAKHIFVDEAFSYFASHAVITISGTAVQIPGGHGMIPHPHVFTFDGSYFFSGLLVLALSEVFRQGLALKKDSELTI
jgi:hypothetical protein